MGERVRWLFVLAMCVLASSCWAEPAAPPGDAGAVSSRPGSQASNSVPLESRITMEQAMALVQQAPGARTHGLGVESPDSLVQTVANAAAVEMVVDNERMIMRFAKQGGQWAWIGTTSSNWPGQTKSPADVMTWLATRRR